ncbi:transcriptional coactivator p15/PC4 family protein [Burkholderia sp. SR8]|uniref:transcriptional coactivator p15/PC4 family protein n=1 Tax=Burkholderia sp. SR8 TaxID=3062277 RepID=UPI004062E94A
MADNHQPPICEIQRGSRERLRVELTERNGKWYVDCRVWFVGADGNFKPSGKGVCIRRDHLAPLIQGLGLAARALDGEVR